jgi:hypothetical protein
MYPRPFPALVLVVCHLFASGCDEEHDPPSQQAVEEAWKRADQAVQNSVAAQADVKHIVRLRDIDRLRYQADVADLTLQVSTLRGLAIGLSLALLAALIWLAVEIRRRRILVAIVNHARTVETDRHTCDTPDGGSSPLFTWASFWSPLAKNGRKKRSRTGTQLPDLASVISH